MNRSIDRLTLSPVCASLILLLCTFNLSCSSSPCAPVFHAVEKLNSIAFHSFGSIERTDGSAGSGESIHIDGALYVEDHGKWTMVGAPNEGRKSVGDEFKAATSTSCHLEGTEFIDGESADYFVTEGKVEG